MVWLVSLNMYYIVYIYEAREFVLFCHIEISQTTMLHDVILVSSKSFWWVGAPTWFEIGWSYGVEAIDDWIIFSIKMKQNRNWKKYWNLGVYLVC